MRGKWSAQVSSQGTGHAPQVQHGDRAPCTGRGTAAGGYVEIGGKDGLKTLARKWASFPLPSEQQLLSSPLTNWDARELPHESDAIDSPEQSEYLEDEYFEEAPPPPPPCW